MKSFETHPMNSETGIGSFIDLELSREDEDDLLHSLLEYADRLPLLAEPSALEKTADGISLNHHADASSELYGRIWNRYDSMDMNFIKRKDTQPEARLHFKSPQKYDGSLLSYNPYQGAWTLSSYNRSQPPRIITNNQVLTILAQKLNYSNDIETMILHKDTLGADEFPDAIMQILAPLAKSTTEQRSYVAETIVENDAYSSPLVARFSKDEGAIAVDYRIRLEVKDIPIVPASFAPNSQASHITHVYEHTVTTPYESDRPEFTETTFSILTSDETLSQKYISALAEAEREANQTGDALRRAFDIIGDQYS